MLMIAIAKLVNCEVLYKNEQQTWVFVKPSSQFPYSIISTMFNSF